MGQQRSQGWRERERGDRSVGRSVGREGGRECRRQDKLGICKLPKKKEVFREIDVLVPLKWGWGGVWGR